ncbi:RHS repeat-associated core domain-containing protein [Streptomyces sp. 5K101]|uniref:RHS repeat-associated core domain-containing protein n=1 Tax=Streptomyces sp. 5K101 TaxID=3390037 RepID=UPI003975123C
MDSHSEHTRCRSRTRPAPSPTPCVSGREVNTATPGGHITTTEYDRFGNTVRELSAGNRALALGISAADRAVQEDLGIRLLPSAERANLLAAISVFNETGTRALEKLGPLRRIDLTADLKSGTTTLVAAGTSVTARSWVINEYDTSRPTDGTAKVRDQLTKSTIGAQVREHSTVHGETRTSQISYDWAKGLPTQTVQDPGGLAITTTTEYDAQGRVTKQLRPGTTGTDAATRVTTYWTATGTGTCQGRPEWADLVCSTGPAGAITGGGTNPSQMPTTTTEYNWWGRSATVRDTANGSTRTTTIQYDAVGRPTRTAITGGIGQAVPESTTEYDPATGHPVKLTSPTGGTIIKAYDKLGRLISYTDADGGITTTEYDLLNRPETTDNSPSTVTYTYDHAVEPRGLATKATDSVAGIFQAAYDADGSVLSQKLPGGYTLQHTEDTTGASVRRRTYTRDSDGVSIMTDTVTRSVLGQVTTHAGWSNQSYAYDKAGRLATVEDTADTVCTRRTYAFDSRSNRTSLTTNAGAPGVDCPTTGGTTNNHTYDSADRIVDTGYTYDAFGRATATPGNGTMAYYANDLAYQQTANGERQTWQLDARLRFRSWKTETGSGSTWTQTASKINHYDSDGGNPRWIIEDTATGALTRNVNGLDGGLAATTTKTGGTVLQLTNIHGDVSLLLPLDTSIAPTVLDADEYGNSKVGRTEARYSWLGSQGVSKDALGGLLVAGVRVYNPVTGLFLSPDPVVGGNPNAYGYPTDPVNYMDADGRYAIAMNPGALLALGTAILIGYIILLATAWICQQLGCSISLPGPNVAIPDKNSGSAKKYKNTKYIGYMIYYKGKIWKYGISRVGNSRPASQIRTCNKYYGTSSGCRYTVLRRNLGGWFYARSWEAAMILQYVARHGHCPPGQAKKVCR